MQETQEMKETQSRSAGGEDPWRKKGQPILVFFPGESHEQRSLRVYNAEGHKELDTTQMT